MQPLLNCATILPLALEHAGNKVPVVFASAPLSAFDQLSVRSEEILSPRELAFFRSREFPRKQRSYLLGRYVAKMALGTWLNSTSWNEIDVRPGVFDQPVVHGAFPELPCVSISHCEDLAVAVAFPQAYPMGIDVECIDIAMIPTMQSQMCAGEKDWAKSDETTRSALVWSNKEALSKALKCGLTTSFELLEAESLMLVEGAAWRGSYRHFKQYQSLSLHSEKHALSLAFPVPLAVPAAAQIRSLITAA